LVPIYTISWFGCVFVFMWVFGNILVPGGMVLFFAIAASVIVLLMLCGRGRENM